MKKEDKILLEKAINPFTLQDFVEVREVPVTNKLVSVRDIQDGVIIKKPSEIKTTYLVEDSKFCKVYTRLGFRLHVSELSDNSKSLFLWMIYDLDYNEEFIEFDTKRIKKYRIENNKSNVEFLDSLKELIRASIISHTGIGRIYWINPLFFFNGNRLKKYPDKIIERT